MKDKTIKHLVEALNEAGIMNSETVQGGKNTIYYWLDTDKLKLRTKPQSNYNVVNDEEISEIIKEFSPGGSGKWHWDEN